MVQKIMSSLVDDLDGSDAQGNVRFALDGTDYEIDLNEEHAAELRGILSRYVEKGRKIRVQRARPGRQTREDLPDIRAWAQARGHDIKDRGRVPAQIVAEYDALRSTRSAS